MLYHSSDAVFELRPVFLCSQIWVSFLPFWIAIVFSVCMVSRKIQLASEYSIRQILYRLPGGRKLIDIDSTSVIQNNLFRNRLKTLHFCRILNSTFFPCFILTFITNFITSDKTFQTFAFFVFHFITLNQLIHKSMTFVWSTVINSF